MRCLLFAFLVASALSRAPLQVDALRHHFTLLSDVHYDPNYGTPAGYGKCNVAAAPPMGHQGCDSPLALVSSVFADIAANAPDDSYLVFTGDWMRHGIPMEEAAATFRNVTNFVKSLPHTTIAAPSFAMASLGNNDFIPDYFFNVSNPANSTVGMLGSLLRDADLIDDAELASFAKAAYYSRTLPTVNLKFMVLNTLPYSVSLEPPIDPTVIPDPVGQFAWMENELASAAATNTSVVLISHIPPVMNAQKCVFGNFQSMIQGDYLETWRGIVQRYSSVIVYQFFGHTHQMSFLADPDFVAPGLIIPSITKIFGNTASYLMCEYDDELKTFLNFQMRHLDEDERSWSTLASPGGSVYLDAEIGPLSTLGEIKQTALSLITNATIWERYATAHAGGVYANMWPGATDEDTVRLRHACSMLAFSVGDYESCLVTYSNLTSAPSSAPSNEEVHPAVIALIVIAAVVGIGFLVFMSVYAKKHFEKAEPHGESEGLLNA